MEAHRIFDNTTRRAVYGKNIVREFENCRFSEKIVGLVPARGGSKSILKKNIHRLGEHPLIDYVIYAAKASERLSGIYCSTDDSDIARIAKSAGASVIERPFELASDGSPVADTVRHFLFQYYKENAVMPQGVALLQPTSPFVLPDQIDASCKLLEQDPVAGSVQTFTEMPHNFHAFNQREIVDGYLRFRFEKARLKAYNKQTKPKLYVFGNLVITRSKKFLVDGHIFAKPSVGLEIPQMYSIDVDTLSDFEVAEWYLATGRLELSHLKG